MTNDESSLQVKISNSWSNLNELEKLYNYYNNYNYNDKELKFAITKQVEKIKNRILELQFNNSIGSSLDGISEKDKTKIKQVFNNFHNRINNLQEENLNNYKIYSVQVEDIITLTAIDEEKNKIRIKIVNSIDKNSQREINNIHEFPYNHVVSRNLINSKVGDEIQLTKESEKVWLISEIKKNNYKIIHSIE